MTIDPETLAEIIEAMKSAAARLRGERCELSDRRAAGSLDRARYELVEIANKEAPDLLELCRRSLRALDEDYFPQLRDDLRDAIDKTEELNQ